MLCLTKRLGVEYMNIVEMFEVMDQAKGKQAPDKVTLIDAQLRFVREVDGSIEHVNGLSMLIDWQTSCRNTLSNRPNEVVSLCIDLQYRLTYQ